MGGYGRRVDAHGAKLGHAEDDVVSSHPVGPIQNRSLGSKLYQERHDNHRDDEREQSKHDERYVEESFHNLIICL